MSSEKEGAPADPRNRLNDLSNREWLRETKSFRLSEVVAEEGWPAELVEQFGAWLRETQGEATAERLLDQVCSSIQWSRTPPRSALKADHPATFSEPDIERLVRFFSKRGELVLDPFAGTGSALLAAAACDRRGLGLELSEHWAQVARRRLEAEGGPAVAGQAEVRCCDALDGLCALDEGGVDFIVTSPPYWHILRKRPGLKVEAERLSRGRATHYSEDPGDLGNEPDYEAFLSRLGEVFGACLRPLRSGRYLCVIVSDFRDGPRFVLFHADLAREIETRGFELKGITVLLQDNKNLYPFAIPYAFVSNIHHQYILIFQKPAPRARR